MTESDSAGRPEQPDRSKRTGTHEKEFRHYLSFILSAVLLLAVIGLAAAVIVIPKIAGAIPLTVLTSSMVPHFPPGTLVIVKPVDADNLRVGDVATYQISSGKPGVITHRIVAIHSSTNGSRTFQFKGDNNSDPDPNDIVEAQIQGRLWYSVPLLGYVNNAVNGMNRAWIIPVGVILLFAYAAYAIASGWRSAVRAKRARPR